MTSSPDRCVVAAADRPLIGVLGGMGPLAALDLMQKMLAETDAASDQLQIPVVCWNVPQIPDRQRALAGSGESPLAAMQEGISFLNLAGATRIVIACNTAHAWFDILNAGSRAPIVHIAEATLEALPPTTERQLTSVGLLATQGTLDANLYQARLAVRGFACHANTAEEQRTLFTPGCYAIKCGKMDEGAALLEAAAQCLVERGAQRLLLACTEVPVALAHTASPLLSISIDPTRALAQACARYWLQSRSPVAAV